MTDGRKTDEKLISINQVKINSCVSQLLCWIWIWYNLKKFQGSFHVGESLAMWKFAKYVVSLQKYARISPKMCNFFAYYANGQSQWIFWRLLEGFIQSSLEVLLCSVIHGTETYLFISCSKYTPRPTLFIISNSSRGNIVRTA